MSSLRLAFLGDPSSVHLHRWLRTFVTRGHAVALLEPSPAAPAANPFELPEGVERLPIRSLPAHLGRGVLAARADLRRHLDAWRPDVLHAHYARRPAWQAWLSGWRPYVVTVWGSDVLVTGPMTRVGRVATRLALRDAAIVTAASQRLASAAVALGARPERVRAAELGIDTGRFRPGPADDALRGALRLQGLRVILSPRMLAPLYRHEVVIEALAALPADVVVLSTAMLADPVERARLEAHASRLGVLERWRILPALDTAQMADLYRLADVNVSVPETDAMAQSVLEAMASGRPSVVSDLPDAREWLAELTPDWLVPVGDAKATAAALRDALSLSPSARDALGARLRQRVMDRADARRNMDMVEAWYGELAEAARR